jgi:hypothetical protein
MPPINPTDPWLLEMEPGQWITCTDQELRLATEMALGDTFTLEHAKIVLRLWLSDGTLRANPGRTHEAMA